MTNNPKPAAPAARTALETVAQRNARKRREGEEKRRALRNRPLEGNAALKALSASLKSNNR